MKTKTSFRPLLANNARSLILGSMPGEKSLQMNQYYAHPQNSFWYILGRLFGFDPEDSYEHRVKRITDLGICVWDVLESCLRDGSLDSAIKTSSVVSNNFELLFSTHTNIKTVFFNGAKAEQLYRKLVLPVIEGKVTEVQYIRLPSTSPAHAAMSKKQKLKQWRIIKDKLEST